jgi:hypothetical protein
VPDYKPDGLARRPAPTAPDYKPVGYWPFETLQGVWTRDASGHRLHGLVNGRVKLVDGKVGQALELDGSGFVEVTDAPELALTQELTVMAWVFPRQVGSMRIVDKGPVGRSDAFLLDTHPENHVRVITCLTTVNTQETLPVNEWTHVAFTFGGGVLRVYLNGELKLEQAGLLGELNTTTLPLRLGADSEGASRFVGLLDEIQILGRALTAEAIRAEAR